MVAVFIVDRGKRCRFINAVAEVLTGFSAAQAVGKPFGDLLWRSTPDSFENSILARVLESGSPGEGEIAIVDGRRVRRPLAFRVIPLSLDDGGGATAIELVDLSGETGTGRALRESEQRLRLAAEATGIGIWDVNVVTGERRWSPEFISILGLPQDVEPSTELFSSRIHPDDRSRVDEQYARAYQHPSDDPYSSEFRIVRADTGIERWVSTTGRVSFDGEGRAIRGVGTLRDIHERRTSEESLRESEERLRIALIAGRMGMWRADLNTGLQHWDATQYQILGIDPAAKPSRELFLSIVHPDDRGSVAIDLEHLPPNTFLDSEFRIRMASGEIRWLRAHAVLRGDARGRPMDMIGVNFDITDQKRADEALRESEERNRLAIESNEIGTWDYDLLTGQHLWSDQFKRLWGLSPETPADPVVLHPLVDEADWDVIRQRWADAMKDSSDRINLEYQVRRADTGERRWCSFAGRIFFDQDRRRAVRAIGIMIDTTARRAAEDRRRVAVMEVHHRVKNNLAIVQAILAQTLRSELKGDDAFGRIQPRLMSMARVHDHLARSEQGEVPLRVLIADEVASEGLDRLQVSLSGSMVVLDSAAALALGLAVHELATNAKRFGSLSGDGGKVEISWTTARSQRPRLEIDWKENGGPRVARHPAGLGMRLVESSLHGLGGTAESEFRPDGIYWRLSLPLPATTPPAQ